MNTTEETATAEPSTYAHTEPKPHAPSSTPSSAATATAEDFHPTVQAISRIKTAGRTYAKRTKVAADINELVSITGDLMSSLKEDDPMEATLRKQSALFDTAFTTLLMKTTRDDGFDETAFDAALRTQRQYRMTCQTLLKIKKDKEQTEEKAQKASESEMRRPRFSDPFAGI